MEEKYKIINKELVLKNQNYKGFIDSLTKEVTSLKQKEIEMYQENRRLREEIEKDEAVKRRIVHHSTEISKNLTSIMNLLYLKEYPNGMIRSPSDMSSYLQNSVNSVSRLEPEMNSALHHSRNSLTKSHISRRRKRLSSCLASSSPLDRNSEELGEGISKKRSSLISMSRGSLCEIVSSPPRNSFYNTSTEERDFPLERLEEDFGEGTSQNAIQSSSPPHRISTILEEFDLSNTCKSLNTMKSALISKSRLQVTNESNEILEKSSFTSATEIQKENGELQVSVTSAISIRTPKVKVQKTQTRNCDVIDDNMTISRVPCSTPYNQSQKKNSISDNCSDDLSKLKSVKVRVKKLSSKELDSFDIKMNSTMKNLKNMKYKDDENGIDNNREVKEQEQKKNIKTNNKKKGTKNNKKLSRVNIENSNDNNETNENTVIKKTVKNENIENEVIITSTEGRRTRNRSAKCLAEPNLRHKLRR